MQKKGILVIELMRFLCITFWVHIGTRGVASLLFLYLKYLSGH